MTASQDYLGAALILQLEGHTRVDEGEGAKAVPERVQLDGGRDGFLPHGKVVEEAEGGHHCAAMAGSLPGVLVNGLPPAVHEEGRESGAVIACL